jgi:hypothetical protein
MTRMRRILTIGFASSFLLAAGAYAQKAQDDTAKRAQLLTTGRITKIDTKKKILKVRTENDHSSTAPSQQPQGTGRRGRIGGGGRRGAGRNGGGFPGGSPFPGGGGGRPTSQPRDQGKEFKVVVTDKTAIKEGEGSISFLNLNVGDHISIQGLPKGSGDDMEASQITLMK